TPRNDDPGPATLQRGCGSGPGRAMGHSERNSLQANVITAISRARKPNSNALRTAVSQTIKRAMIANVPIRAEARIFDTDLNI
ncbi:MAG: hypothetical protein ACC619_10505, partial [Paracoccaceae bacterium]